MLFSDKDIKISKEKDIMKFEDLNFKNLELEKLKLNLNKLLSMFNKIKILWAMKNWPKEYIK